MAYKINACKILLLFEAFTACLLSKEYMQTRNCIMLLTRIESYFPQIDSLALELEHAVEKLIENEAREDVKVMAIR